MLSSKSWIGVMCITSQITMLVAASDLFTCEYLHSAHFHMYHTKSLYFNTDPTVIESTPIDVISFEHEASRMVKLLCFFKNLSENDIWLVYIYAYKIHKFYEAKVNETSVQPGDIDKTLEMHDFVFTQIGNYLIANDCGKNINYDEQLNSCTDEEDLTNKNHCHAINTRDDNIIRIQNVKTNKETINEFIDMKTKESRHDNCPIEFEIDFTSEIYFLNEDDIRPFFNEFLIDPRSPHDWDDAIKNLEETRELTHIAGLEGIKNLTVYRRMFIDILKVIMLRFSWRYTMAEIRCLGREHEFADVLKQFHDKLYLEDDKIFLQLSIMFKQVILRQISIIEQIEIMISYLTNAAGSVYVRPQPREEYNTILTISKKFIGKLSSHCGIGEYSYRNKAFDNMVDTKLFGKEERGNRPRSNLEYQPPGKRVNLLARSFTSSNSFYPMCEYYYSVHNHMYHTKNIYFHTDLDVVKPTPIDVISIEQEASRMVTLLYDTQNALMDDIWLVYIYAYKINTFYEAKIKNTSFEYDYIVKTLEMHDFVFTQMENALKVNNCGKNINYNEQINSCTDKEGLTNENHSHAINTCVGNIIKTNKKTINELIKSEFRFGEYNSDFLKPIDYISQLHFVDDNHGPFFHQFLIDDRSRENWGNAIGMIEEARKRTQVAGLEGIKNLAEYQRLFFDMLKVIMLNLAWSYTIAMPDDRSGSNDFAEILIRFHKLLYLKEGIFFELSDLFGNVLTTKQTIIKKIINEIIRDVPIATGCLNVAPITKENYNTILKFSRDFIATIKRKCDGNCLKIVQFVNMADTKLSNIENYYH